MRKNDRFKATLYGVGYLGKGIHRSKIKVSKGKCVKNRDYVIWEAMMMRCYSEKFLEKCPTYVGCKVCDRWHNFQTFCEDIKNLENYNEWKNFKIEKGKRNKWKLDKDSKVKGNRIYGPDTCRFITSKENCSRENRKNRTTGLTYVATSPDKNTFEFNNINEFCDKHNLNVGNVGSCIRELKGHKSVKGWTFKTI